MAGTGSGHAYRLEFGLGQGWARGLRIVFATRDESARIDRERSLCADQYHSDVVIEADLKRVGSQGRADGVIGSDDSFRDSGLGLLVKTADCAPLVFVDRESRKVAAVHAGWRGMAQGIHRKPFDRGFNPKTTWVWVGPCLNGESFEVAADMWERFGRDADDSQFFSAVPGKTDRRYFHAWRWLARELNQLGTELVYNVEVDTFTDADFASYRRSMKAGEKLGQHNYTWVGWGEIPTRP